MAAASAAATPPAAPTSWRVLASEDWVAPIFGGYARAGDYTGCVGQADQDVAMPAPVVPPGATWVTIGPMAGASWAAGIQAAGRKLLREELSRVTPGLLWALCV